MSHETCWESFLSSLTGMANESRAESWKWRLIEDHKIAPRIPMVDAEPGVLNRCMEWVEPPTNAIDAPHAVLIRAVEPVEGIELMRKRRSGQPDHNLTNGPGKLCIALDIDRRLDGDDLLGNKVWLEENVKVPRSRIMSGPRIGIDYAAEWKDKPWRFWIKENPFVSRR